MILNCTITIWSQTFPLLVLEKVFLGHTRYKYVVYSYTRALFCNGTFENTCTMINTHWSVFRHGPDFFELRKPLFEVGTQKRKSEREERERISQREHLRRRRTPHTHKHTHKKKMENYNGGAVSSCRLFSSN